MLDTSETGVDFCCALRCCCGVNTLDLSEPVTGTLGLILQPGMNRAYSLHRVVVG